MKISKNLPSGLKSTTIQQQVSKVQNNFHKRRAKFHGIHPESLDFFSLKFEILITVCVVRDLMDISLPRDQTVYLLFGT